MKTVKAELLQRAERTPQALAAPVEQAAKKAIPLVTVVGPVEVGDTQEMDTEATAHGTEEHCPEH